MTKKDLSEITNSDINSINDAIKDLKKKYSNPNSAIELNAVNNSFSLELKSSLNEFVDDLLPSDLKTSCLLYTSPSPRDGLLSRMPSSA